MNRYYFILLSLFISSVFANPTGEKVTNGECQFQRSDNTLTIGNSDKAIIHWDDFSIQENEKTKFNQLSPSSQVLNRVVTNNPSHIHGLLESNGKVFLINQSGIVVGPSGVINTKGFIASTLNINDAEFLGDQEMTLKSDNTSKIENHGKIFGDVYLIAREIQNTGEIQADNVVLAAATEVILQPSDERFQVSVSGEGTIKNSGLIDAVQVDLRSAGGNVFALAINQEGIIHVTGTKEIDGKIILCSENEGIVKVTGDITCQNEDQTGGRVHILGEYVQLLDDATIDVSGDFGGGTLLCGGDYKGQNPDIPNSRALYVGENVLITADANLDGNGGKVIFWGDELNYFYGSISAKGGIVKGDGGFVEISSLGKLEPKISKVFVNSYNGENGTLLLDPSNVTVRLGVSDPAPSILPNFTLYNPGVDPLSEGTAPPPSYLNNIELQTSLNNGNNILVSTAGGVAGTGIISVEAPVAWNTSALTFTTTGDVNVTTGGALTLSGNAAFTVSNCQDFQVINTGTVSNSGSGEINITATQTVNLGGGGTTISGSGSLTTNSGTTTTISAGGAATALFLFGSGSANINSTLRTRVNGSNVSPIIGTGSGSLNITSTEGVEFLGPAASNVQPLLVVDFSAATSSGNINIKANELGTTAGNFHGCEFRSVGISTYDGDISIIAKAGTTAGNHGFHWYRQAPYNNGLLPNRIRAYGSGNVTIDAFSSVGNGIRIANNVAIYEGQHVIDTLGNGNVNVTGTAAVSTGIRILINNRITYRSTGSGNVNVTGISNGGGLGYQNIGGFNVVDFSSNGGNITLTGTSAGNIGWYRLGPIRTTGNGNITVNATGVGDNGLYSDFLEIESQDGDINITGNGSRGIYFNNNISFMDVKTTGSGNINLDGNGSSGEGIYIRGVLFNSPVFSTISGDLTINAVGSTYGLRASYNPVGDIEMSTQTGNVNINGTGTTQAGIELVNTDVRAIAAGSTANLIASSAVTPALVIGTNSLIGTAVDAGTHILTTNTMSIDPTSELNTSGSIVFQPLTAGASIGVGTGVGTLNISNADLNRVGISAIPSNVIIGSNSQGHTINVNNVTPANPTEYTFRGNNVSVDNFNIGANPLNYSIAQAGIGLADIGNTITSGTITVIGNGAAANNTLQAQDIVNTWNVTSDNTGNINGAGVIDFANVGNLIGGNLNDTFIFADQQGVAGQIDGGAPPIGNILDYTAFTTPAVIEFLGTYDGLASNMGTGFFNIENIIGNWILFEVAIPTITTQISLDLAYRYLHMNVGKDDLFTYLQFWFDNNVVENPNAYWLMLNSFVFYKMLANGLNNPKEFNIVNEPPPLNAVQGVFSPY